MTRCIPVTGLILAGLLALPAAAEQRAVLSIDWAGLQTSGAARVVVEGPGGSAAVAVEADAAGLRQPLLALDEPGVHGPAYALVGDVRHEGVEKPGYLEMWSVLPDGSRYFSRTLAQAGPLRKLAGSADWRPFQLPFALGDGPAPTRIELDLVLPGAGRVWVGPLRLVQLDAPGLAAIPGTAGAWWDDTTGGWLGGIAGSALGVCGALLGTLGGLGRARGFVLGLLSLLAAGGVVALGVGLYALTTGQPYAVWYPLTLCGAIAALVNGLLLPGVRRRYEHAELRRMRALDTPGTAAGH